MSVSSKAADEADKKHISGPAKKRYVGGAINRAKQEKAGTAKKPAAKASPAKKAAKATPAKKAAKATPAKKDETARKAAYDKLYREGLDLHYTGVLDKERELRKTTDELDHVRHARVGYSMSSRRSEINRLTEKSRKLRAELAANKKREAAILKQLDKLK